MKNNVPESNPFDKFWHETEQDASYWLEMSILAASEGDPKHKVIGHIKKAQRCLRKERKSATTLAEKQADEIALKRLHNINILHL